MILLQFKSIFDKQNAKFNFYLLCPNKQKQYLVIKGL